MSVYLYNKVDFNKIKFSNKPYKKIKTILVGDERVTKSIYYIDILYKNAPLYIQIPSCKLELIDECDNMICLLTERIFYDSFIKDLENYIINNVYKNSETWFLGKVFTMNKLIKCFVSFVELLEGGLIKIYINYNRNLKIFDTFKNEMSLDKIKRENIRDVVCVLGIENLQFIDNMFTCNLVMEQMKVYKENKLNEYSIMDTDSTVVSLDKSKNDCTSSDLDDEYYKEK
jgi:hypothetical protein